MHLPRAPVPFPPAPARTASPQGAQQAQARSERDELCYTRSSDRETGLLHVPQDPPAQLQDPLVQLTDPPGLAAGKARLMPGLELASGKPSALPVPAHLGEDMGASQGPGGAGGDAAGQQRRQGCS